MAKNLIPEIARMLGVELGEVFTLKGYEHDEYRISEKYGLAHRHRTFREEWQTAETMFRDLIYGRAEIIKLPWKPKEGDAFYSFRCLGSDFKGLGYIPEKSDYTWRVEGCTWNNSAVAFALLKAGWVYRSKAAAEAALPTVAAEMGVEYEL